MRTRNTFLFILVISLFSMVSLNEKSRAASSSLNPHKDATVSIKMDGLMALCLGNPEHASIGILDAIHHSPEIRVVKIKDNQQSEVALINGEQIKGTLSIDVDGRTKQGIDL